MIPWHPRCFRHKNEDVYAEPCPAVVPSIRARWRQPEGRGQMRLSLHGTLQRLDRLGHQRTLLPGKLRKNRFNLYHS